MSMWMTFVGGIETLTPLAQLEPDPSVKEQPAEMMTSAELAVVGPASIQKYHDISQREARSLLR